MVMANINIVTDGHAENYKPQEFLNRLFVVFSKEVIGSLLWGVD
jgi:hypothetical protein